MATPYTIPEGCFYIDEGAAAAYAAQSGDEIVIRQLVNLPTGETLDSWIQLVWIAGTEKEITPGEGRGYVNHKRLIGRLGAEEQIISAGLPSATDANGAVPTIQYKITHFGPLPILDHMGLVHFVPQATTAQTEIVWTIKLQLAKEGGAVFADPKTVPPFLVNAISGLLAGMAKTVDAAQ